MRPRAAHAGAPSASMTSATSRPFRKQPETLIANVDQGKSESTCRSISESTPNRASAPAAPPDATAKTTGMMSPFDR